MHRKGRKNRMQWQIAYYQAFEIKMAAGFFISTRHSEQHFEAETSEFRGEIKF